MEEAPERRWSTTPNWSVVVLVALLCCTVALGGFFLVREHRQTQDLAAGNQKLAASLNQVQGQLAAVADKLNALASAPPPAPLAVERPSPMPEKPHVTAKRRMTAHRAADDPRWKQIQVRLADQQKELASTRDEVEKARNDLQGNLNSTRDELNGSIARTHDELVTLEKRGEKNYVEFQLDKSKTFQRVGPISLSLRKVDFKKKHYDLSMMVDDFELQKKSVNLFEPVWITLSDHPQPVELVVNEIHKDEIKGYISEPKYKKSELVSAATPAQGPKLQAGGTPQ
jgi:septal ring factor EnvC (AmiA/AmiB activator)